MIPLIVLLSTLLLVPANLLESEEQTSQQPMPPAQDSIISPQESILEERKQVFQYGTEGEILELLKTLKEQKDRTLVDHIISLLEGKVSLKLTRGIFDFLQTLQLIDPRSEGHAVKLLQAQEELDQETILTLLQYLSLPETKSHLEEVLPLLKDSRRRIVTATVRYLGKKGNEEVVTQLIDLFKGQEAEEDLRTAILTALGELKATNAVEFLRSILDNPDERMVYRRFACDALGKIGSKEAYPSIKKALEESDNLLRAYAVSALGSYKEEEVETILLQALRDDFARVRASAAEQLGNRKTQSAVEMLRYRVRRDADRQVRFASLRALSEIGDEKSFSFLQDLLLDERASLDLRMETIRLFLQNPSEKGMNAIRTLLEREWTKENSRLLDEACKQLSLQTMAENGDLYQKMLSHRSFIIRIYGIRGIGRNNIQEATDQLRQMAKEGASPQERKEARLVLEQWGKSP